MKILATLIDEMNLNLVDGIIMPINHFSICANKYYSLDEVKEYVNIKDTYLSLNKLFHENELEDLEKFFIELKNIQIKGIFFSDMAIYTLAIKYNLLKLLIYAPNTLVVSYEDFNTFSDIFGVMLSPTIKKEEIPLFNRRSNRLFILGYGYVNLFYSKRKLITNYAKQYKIDYQSLINNYNLHLKEELRDDYYPILEDENGTFIFSPNPLNLLKEDLSKDVDYLVIDLLFENALEDVFKKPSNKKGFYYR